MKPLVFVETNFLVSLLFSHLDHRIYQDAQNLLKANREEYDLIIPFYSTFESLGTIRRIKKDLKDWVRGLNRNLKNLRKSEMITGDQATLIEQLEAYSAGDTETALHEILGQLEVIHIDTPILELARNVISPLNIFSRGDAMDAYI